MKKKILLVTAIIAAAGIYTATAQDQSKIYRGRIIDAPYFDISQRVLFSQNDFIYGTSRSAAMGGAFTSLGANLSSMNINPAGLGMYTTSDWGFSQSLSITSVNTGTSRVTPGTVSSGGTRTSYGLDNLSVVFNGFNRSSGSLTSLNFGFGYNRLANFNSRSFVSTSGELLSIADMFAHQFENIINDPKHPVPVEDLNASSRPFDVDGLLFLHEYGSVLGYQTDFITSDGSSVHTAIGDAIANSHMQSVTKGGIYDYTFSMGLNVDNIFYGGMTLGATQINYQEALSYQETFSTITGRMRYDMNTSLSGVGYSMKLGIVVRPVVPLRIGVAFHLPTYYTLNKAYRSEMSFARPASSGVLEDEQRFNTAPRLLAGISYVIAGRVIVALDYESAWFNKIRTRNTYLQDEERSRNESRNLLKPQHSIRAGLEFLANDIVSVRLGGGFQTNIMREKEIYNTNPLKFWPGNIPTAYRGYHVSCGLGFNVGRNAYIDLAYIFKHSDYADYTHFLEINDASMNDFIGQIDETNDGPVPREYRQHKNYNMISLTFGSRF